MPRYKVQVSKNQKKYSIVIQSSSLKEAREKVHRDWYSVLNIEEFQEKIQWKDRFYFTVSKLWKVKSWSTYGDDIFKIYLKLKKDLWYDILELYKNKEDTEETKQLLLKNLDDAFRIHEKNQKKSSGKNDKKLERAVKREETIDDFYMKKELETTYKLIDFVIAKIETVLSSQNLWKIDEVRKKKIEQVYQNIIQIKKSTNTSKLKEIGELALLRIWQLELEIVEKEKNIYAKEYLKETNKLLKKIGSDKHFVEKDKDIKVQVEIYIQKFKKWIKTQRAHRKNAKKYNIDKTSYDYLKTVALLNRYKERNKQLRKYILGHFWEYFIPSKKAEFSKLLLTHAVLRQNIIIMKAKKSWKIYSYTKLVKGYEKIFQYLENIISAFNTYLFAVISIFSFTFLFIISSNYFFNSQIENLNFNYYGLYWVILMILFSWLSKMIKWSWTLWISTLAFFLISFFWKVNF